MATLEKIRGKAGLLVIVIGVALLAFIVGDFLNSGSHLFYDEQKQGCGSKRNEDYNRRVPAKS